MVWEFRHSIRWAPTPNRARDGGPVHVGGHAARRDSVAYASGPRMRVIECARLQRQERCRSAEESGRRMSARKITGKFAVGAAFAPGPSTEAA
jgi:hypothetical protein